MLEKCRPQYLAHSLLGLTSTVRSHVHNALFIDPVISTIHSKQVHVVNDECCGIVEGVTVADLRIGGAYDGVSAVDEEVVVPTEGVALGGVVVTAAEVDDGWVNNILLFHVDVNLPVLRPLHFSVNLAGGVKVVGPFDWGGLFGHCVEDNVFVGGDGFFSVATFQGEIEEPGVVVERLQKRIGHGRRPERLPDQPIFQSLHNFRIGVDVTMCKNNVDEEPQKSDQRPSKGNIARASEWQIQIYRVDNKAIPSIQIIETMAQKPAKILQKS